MDTATNALAFANGLAKAHADAEALANPDTVALVAYTVDFHTANIRVDTTITNLNRDEVEAFTLTLTDVLAGDAFRLAATRCLHALVAEAVARTRR